VPNSNAAASAILAAGLLAGCAHYHPLPENVGTRLPTEQIVKFARCERRSGVVRYVKSWLDYQQVRDFPAETLGGDFARFKAAYRKQPETLAGWQEYLDIAIVYLWEFEIAENDNAGSTLEFLFPLARGLMGARARQQPGVGARGEAHLLLLGDGGDAADGVIPRLVQQPRPAGADGGGPGGAL
jgi:hypothetical protein